MFFRFEPYVRPMIWGSETWILSAYPKMESIVVSGQYAGKTLSQLVRDLGSDLVGRQVFERFGNDFPLLIKFIDARDNLSIQVHPSDRLAQKQGKGNVGKTEMWYGLKGAPNAFLLSGLKEQLTPETYKQHVLNHSIVNDIARYNPKEGDCFFLPAGRIHAIGSGCYLLEIQQSSDLTYRIYDYDRKDASGNRRELHTDLAAECIDYTVLPDYETHYERKVNAPMNLVNCPYFNTVAYSIVDGHVDIDWSKTDAFLALVIIGGSGVVSVDGEEIPVREKDTILLPATSQKIVLVGTMNVVTASTS